MKTVAVAELKVKPSEFIAGRKNRVELERFIVANSEVFQGIVDQITSVTNACSPRALRQRGKVLRVLKPSLIQTPRLHRILESRSNHDVCCAGFFQGTNTAQQ